MHSERVVISNETGLHARPASIFVNNASQFESNITVICGGREANAKSIISVLALGACKGSEITIKAEGKDEKAAVAKLVDVLKNAEQLSWA